jgi:CheY-like chemotaxis protein
MTFTGTILVVDDDAAMRSVLVEALSAPGCSVLTASGGGEALALLAKHDVNLLITDVRMPGIHGFELARQAKLMRPDLSVIYLSGYYDEAEMHSGPVFGRIMRKPFPLTDLLSEIKRQK